MDKYSKFASSSWRCNLLCLTDTLGSAPTTSYGPPPGVSFDRFVRACVAIKTLTDLFKRADHDNDGWVQLNYDSFMDIFLRAP